MFSTIKLVRIVEPRAEVRDGRAVMTERVKTVCVKFLDGDGIVCASIAFDGRAVYSEDYGGDIREEYSLDADCPVMRIIPNEPWEGLEPAGPTNGALRALRDALNDMNL